MYARYDSGPSMRYNACMDVTRSKGTAAVMSVPETTETCRYPGCDRPALPVAETGGRPPGYC